MTASIAIILLIAHFIGDSLCQTTWTYKHKSQELRALFLHILEYGLIITPFVYFLVDDLIAAVIFALINSIVHFFVDWCSSRLTVSKKFSMHTKTIMHLDYIIHLAFLLLSFEVMFNAPNL